MAASSYRFDQTMLRSFQTSLNNAKHIVILTGKSPCRETYETFAEVRLGN